MTDTARFRYEIEDLDTLPTIPVVVRKLLELFENPKVSLNEIGDFIAKDPALASKVLRAVNSPIYGFPGRISSITQALLLLGLNVVRGLLLGVTVLEIMRKSIVGMWEHSVGSAITARILAKRKQLPDFEEVTVAALLHDIGKVILNLKFPKDYEEVMAEAEQRSIFVVEAERERFNATHADVEAWVAQKWNFPKSLIEIMHCHHTPNLAQHVPVQAAIVHMSDILIRARGFGFGGDAFVPAVNESAWQILDLSKGDIKEVLTEMEDLLEQAEDFLVGCEA